MKSVVYQAAALKAQEDMEDLLAIEEFLANPKEGLPQAFVVRLIDGENALRVFREWRGIAQSELSRLSGVNRVQIADIEAARKSGSIATLKKLAMALGVSLDDLA